VLQGFEELAWCQGPDLVGAFQGDRVFHASSIVLIDGRDLFAAGVGSVAPVGYR